MPRSKRSPAGSRTRRARSAVKVASPDEIVAWEEDPGAPGSAVTPLPRPSPKLNAPPLPVKIVEKAPPTDEYDPGTPEFRYWVAAEALGRASKFWGRVIPAGIKWHRTVGRQLPVRLDAGEDLNAYYDRRGLEFFHANIEGTAVYSGESPDVLSHELGHAVLDALRPQLWDANAIEVAAFHESFGDMSALLCALQLQSFREDVLRATGGRLARTSRLSRVAEQLGWALRQVAPDAVDPDCLRNALNSHFYREPEALPPSAPATSLSSEPHSFSRVFTGSFFRALAAMFTAQPRRDEAALQTVSDDAGALLVGAVLAAPIVPSYFSQVAAHMIELDREQNNGRYRDALASAFIRHGVLALEAATAVGVASAAPSRRGIAALAAAPRAADEPLARVEFAAATFGLTADLVCDAPSQPKRFSVAGADPNVGSVAAPAHDQAARSFLEDLFRRGRIELGNNAAAGGAVVSPLTRKTHEIRREDDALVLSRRSFDCGFAVEAWV